MQVVHISFSRCFQICWHFVASVNLFSPSVFLLNTAALHGLLSFDSGSMAPTLFLIIYFLIYVSIFLQMCRGLSLQDKDRAPDLLDLEL